MRNTVVIFGKGNVGKTTLLGYLYSRNLTRDEFNKQLKNTKKKFGTNYESVEKYAYIISDKNESKNYTDENSGNTKSVHFHPYGKFVLIDTPGNEHAQMQRDMGMFLGDIGIYVIDAQKLLYDINFMEFSQLFLWNTLKGPDNLIIVLSKIDLLDENQLKTAYNNAKILFNQQANLKVPIIPVTIDRNNDEFNDKNITQIHEFDFCENITLKNLLDKMLQNDMVESETQNLCIYAERYFDHSHKNGAGIGRTWRNRILSGNAKREALIKILPIKYNRSYTLATARIKTIKSINDKICDFASEGDVIGLDLSDIRVGGKKVYKDEIVSTRGTIIVDQNTKVHEGDTFMLMVNDSVINATFFELEQFEELYMYWFGKRVLVKILKKEIDNNVCTLFLLRQDAYMVMPIINDEYFYDTITLEKIRGINDNKYFNAKLNCIGYISTIIIENKSSRTIEELKMHIEHHITNRNCTIVCDNVNNSIVIGINSNANNLYKIVDDVYCSIRTEKLNVSVSFSVNPKIV